jgi:asparagine synthase (glutamine-hydrolysing)
MAAIVGLLRFDGAPVEADPLTAMLAAMPHRGSDNLRQWRDGSVGLGQRMFWTTPESLGEKLPLSSADGQLVLTADARIDNRDQLLSTLKLNKSDAEIADSEFILAAYERWDEDCVEHLLGDFAFAIWDARNQRLYCARDHFGVKPFYYFRSNQFFAFATEIKALWRSPAVSRQLNEVQLARFLSGDDSDKEATFFEHVKRLPPAHTLTIPADGEARLRTYWKLDRDLEIHLGSDEEYAERFREIFTEAVRCRLRSAYPIGSALSGGLDSSSVACTARDLLAQAGKTPLHSFSAVYPSIPLSDERTYIEAALAQGGMEPHLFNADEISPFYDRERMLAHMDDFYTGGNLQIVWKTCELAQKQGVRALLHGFDGDTTVSHGFYAIKEMALQGRWHEFATTIETVASQFSAYPNYKTTNMLRLFGYPAFEELGNRKQWHIIASGIEPLHRHFGLSRRKLIKKYLLVPMMPYSLLRHWRRLRNGGSQPVAEQNGIAPIFATLISHEFAQRVQLFAQRQNSEFERSRDFNSDRDEHYFRLNSGTLSRVLELVDMTSAVFGVESRYPFAEKRLIEYCYAIPANQKLHQGLSRYVLRRAMDGILPPEIQWRSAKSNLGPGLTATFRHFGSEILREAVFSRADVIAPYVNLTTVQRAYRNFIEAEVDDDAEITQLWLVAMLSLWLRKDSILSVNS